MPTGTTARRRLLTTVAVISAGALAVGCTPASAGVGAQDGDRAEESLKVIGNAYYAPEHILAKSLVEYGEVVTEASDGAVEFEWFYSDSLVKPVEAAASLADGLMNLSYVTPGYTPADFEADAWVAQFGYGNDPRPVVGLLSAAAAMMEFGFAEPAIAEELEAAGLHPLLPRFQNWDNYQLLCKEPVETLADASGKRVRVGGEAFARIATAMGMEPVTLSGAEIYEGLERGVVDCFMGGEGDMVGLGLWEVAPYYTTVRLPGWNSTALAVQKDWFDALPEQTQGAFTGSMRDFVDIFFTNYLQNQRQFFTEGPDAHGIQLLEADASLEGALEDYFSTLRDDMIENAPASIEDPEAAVETYEELLAKWTDIVLELGYDTGTEDRAAWAQDASFDDIDLAPWAAEVQKQIFDTYR